MSSKPDVLISYSHLSNPDDDSDDNKWVANFHRRLKSRLSERLARDARIWRDNKLRVGSLFGKEIEARLRETKVLLCILTPRYVRSEWCMRELKTFHRFAAENNNLEVANHSRIITVVKSRVPKEMFPPELSGSLYCKFYDESEDAGGVGRELGQNAGEYGYEDYKYKVDQIVESIEHVVGALGDDDREERDIERTVYLAETPRDCADERQKIRHELEARGLLVLPDATLPTDDVNEYSDAVRASLRRSFISIHLMGQTYGALPAGEEKKSTVYLQNELAAEHHKERPQFKRLIWINPEAKNPEDRQVKFLEYLRSSAEAQSGAILHERSFGKLLERVQQLVTKSADRPPTDNLIRIYLMCDKTDDNSVEPVGRFLYDKGYEVIPPPESEEDGRYIEHHKKSLLRCDATITIYGKAGFEWVQDRHDDVVTKSKGWGREARVYCEAILRTPPETKYKSRIFLRPVKVLSPCYHELPCEAELPSCEALTASLNEFVAELEKAINS